MVTLFFILLSTVSAENWFPVGKSGANVVYTAKAFCESAEARQCFEVTNCKQDECVVVDGELVVDQGKKAAKDAKIAKEIDDNRIRQQKKQERKLKIAQDCKNQDSEIVKALCEEVLDE